MWLVVYTTVYVLAMDNPMPRLALDVLNPLRSEDEAFRFLLYAIAVIASDRRPGPDPASDLLSEAYSA